MNSSPVCPLDRDAVFYIAGHKGMVGSAVWRCLRTAGFKNLRGYSHEACDLRDRSTVFRIFSRDKPKYVILAAAKVGGIMANSMYPVDFLSDNLRIQTNVLDAAVECGVDRLLFLGSSCIYPKFAPQPIREEALLSGYLEATNDAYAIAKITGIIQIQAVRRQYHLPWISAMPTNLFGPNDSFSAERSHVLPALIRRYCDAVQTGNETVTNWGSGNPRREFLHVDDLANACLFLMENYDGDQQINVGVGCDSSIRDIAARIARLTGFGGRTEWDSTKPDGTPQKLLDVSKLNQLGWSPRIPFEVGLANTICWYNQHLGNFDRETPISER